MPAYLQREKNRARSLHIRTYHKQEFLSLCKRRTMHIVYLKNLHFLVLVFVKHHLIPLGWVIKVVSHFYRTIRSRSIQSMPKMICGKSKPKTLIILFYLFFPDNLFALSFDFYFFPISISTLHTFE